MSRTTKGLDSLTSVESSTNQTTVLGSTTPSAKARGDRHTNTTCTTQPPKKKRRIHRGPEESSQGNRLDQTLEESPTPALTMAITHLGTSSLIGKIKQGQTTQISKDEVIGYKDLPVEAYEFSALLRPGTTNELMEERSLRLFPGPQRVCGNRNGT